VFGKTWHIYERRKTPSGWNVQLGREVDRSNGSLGVCPTKRLVDFLEKYPDLKFKAEMLPISKFPLIKLRKRLDIHFYSIVEDAFGKKWKIYDRRKTQLGWDVQFGRTFDSSRGSWGICPTKKLVDFLRKFPNYKSEEGLLPFSKNSLVNLRKKLGINPYPIVEDVFGKKWKIYNRRKTPSGFDVQLGKEVIRRHGQKAICPTRELVDFLRKYPDSKFEEKMLPISKSSLLKLRNKLGIASYHYHYHNHDKQWWEQHKIEVIQLSSSHFCEKYGCSIGIVAKWRSALRKNMSQAEYACLVKGREPDKIESWWQARKEELTNLPLKVFAQKYGVSEDVSKKHWKAMQEGMTYREYRLNKRRAHKAK
jgi:hypothetical protein